MFAFHHEADGSLSLESAVYQAVGAASMCWEIPGAGGVFDSEGAQEIAAALLEVIRKETA